MKNIFDGKWLTVFAVFLVFATALPVNAKEGGVKVDSDTNCANGTENNFLCPGSHGHILQSVGRAGLADGTPICNLCNRDDRSCVQVECNFNQVCSDPTYYGSAFTVPGYGKWKITVDVNNGGVIKNVGSDSFSVGSCGG